MKILGTAATIFTTKADLQAAVRAYDANSTDAIATYGAIAGWDVSRIADMSELFLGLQFFNADISNWNTSSVTSMRAMFEFASPSISRSASTPPASRTCATSTCTCTCLNPRRPSTSR